MPAVSNPFRYTWCLVPRGCHSEGAMQCFCQTPGSLALIFLIFALGARRLILNLVLYGPRHSLHFSASVFFICCTSLTFNLPFNCMVGPRFTRDHGLLRAINTNKYLQSSLSFVKTKYRGWCKTFPNAYCSPTLVLIFKSKS